MWSARKSKRPVGPPSASPQRCDWLLLGLAMDSFSIALSGLDAAFKGLDIIGNNVANATTEGFHRQRVEFVPACSVRVGDLILGGGVETAQISRLLDRFVEQQLIQQWSSSGQVSQELTVLRTVESAFGEISDQGTLGTAIDSFFAALSHLSSQPASTVYQDEVVNAGQALSNQFRISGEVLNRVDNDVLLEARSTVEQINVLINQIAELNGKIKNLELGGGQANDLRDQRDGRICKLAELVGIETVEREYGVVDVVVGAIPVVTAANPLELQVDLQAGGLLGLSAAGAQNWTTQVEGGRLAGLFALKNELLLNIRADLDSLAAAIIQQVNQYHVQGVGPDGSFTELCGWRMASENLADFDPPVSNGVVYIRVIDQTTGAISRYQIPVDASTDTLSSIADYIDNNITGLSASADLSRLRIQADPGYKFDFLPAVLPEPTASTLSGTASVAVSGLYTGSTNQTISCTVIGSGEVGNSDSLQIEVRDGSGQLLTTLNVGTGYATGDRLGIGDGVYLSLGRGTLNNGEGFEIEVLATTDTSGLLSAVGLNTFFSGRTAVDIGVCSDVADSVGRVAGSLGPDMTDNANILRMAALRDTALSGLDNLTYGQFYRHLVTQLGQQVAVKDTQQSSIEGITQNLVNQRSEISGVDINEQAAQMLVFERMFQAMAKYMGSVQTYYETLFNLL